MNKNTLITIIVIIILVVLGWAVYAAMENKTAEVDSTSDQMSGDEMVNEPTVVGVSATTTTNSTTTVSTSNEVKSFIVTGKDFSFTPNKLSVKKGDTVKITFVNSDGFHDLKIDAFNVKTKTIPEGQQDVVTFVAGKAGSFEYYCSVGNHRAMGMVGTLTVTE